jgi:Family of unknown function (DUF6476)
MSDILPDPQNSPALKAAKIAVIILSSLIILALIALVVGAVMKLSGGSKKPTAEPPSNFTLAPGSRIIAMESQPGRLILRIKTQTGEEIDILDTANGHLVGQVKAQAEK